MSMTVPYPRQQVAAGEITARRTLPWERLGLIAILALSALLELWHLNHAGYSNQFYAAAVLSMTQNWHAFFFNSLDSVGFVTIDKPPLGFWIQAASAKLLGFSNFAILLPEALATVGSVALVYHLVKRTFGGVVGLLAALMLALVPISATVGRNNTIDSLLVFTLLLAVSTGLKATQRGSLKWLLVTGAIVGLGFEIKMLEAYLVVPALGLLYLLGAPVSRRVRLAHLALASLVMLAISLAWPLAVDLTPASLRPWVDSTQDNSAISLALGYNGIQRLLGERQSLTQFLSGLGIKLSATDTSNAAGPGGPGGMFNNGPAGVLRLFDQQLAGQASWLLPVAMVGVALAAWRALRNRVRFVYSRQGQTAIVFGAWLLTAGAFFSVANFFHSYYLVTLGPPIAVLAAIGLAHTWRLFRSGTWLGWLLPMTLVGTALVQAVILNYYGSNWSRWLSPIAVGGTSLGAAGLVVALVMPALRGRPRLTRAGMVLSVAALLVAPAVWSGYSTLYASNGGIPSAGPQIAGTNGPFGGGPAPAFADRADRAPTNSSGGEPGSGGPEAGVSTALISYLEDNQGSAAYVVATPDSNTAASIILASQQPVMSIGGFTGGDSILTVDQFAQLVQSGQVRYVLAGRGGPQSSSNSAIMSWVRSNGTLVQSSAVGSQTQLYDLSTLQGAAA